MPARAASSAAVAASRAAASTSVVPSPPSESSARPSVSYQLTRSISGYFAMKRSTSSIAAPASSK